MTFNASELDYLISITAADNDLHALPLWHRFVQERNAFRHAKRADLASILANAGVDRADIERTIKTVYP